MRALKFVSLLLCSICFTVTGDAQKPDLAEKPVWTVEVIEVMPGQMGLTLGYLDDHWMRVRQEAKRQGAVLNYHRISEMLMVNFGSETGNPNSIMLLTEYKNLSAFFGREKLFASILEHLATNRPGVVPIKHEKLYKTVDTRVFMEQPADPDSAQFKLLAKQ